VIGRRGKPAPRRAWLNYPHRLPACLLACLPACLLAFLPACLPACLTGFSAASGFDLQLVCPDMAVYQSLTKPYNGYLLDITGCFIVGPAH